MCLLAALFSFGMEMVGTNSESSHRNISNGIDVNVSCITVSIESIKRPSATTNSRPAIAELSALPI